MKTSTRREDAMMVLREVLITEYSASLGEPNYTFDADDFWHGIGVEAIADYTAGYVNTRSTMVAEECSVFDVVALWQAVREAFAAQATR